MQFYYGEKNILRALDEAEFWKHQEAEHTSVIQAVTPGLEEEYTSALNDFGVGFGDAYSGVVKFIESIIRADGGVSGELKTEMLACVRYCVEQSQKFTDFLDHMLRTSKAVRSNGVSQTVIHHIMRESKYFIGIEQLMLA